MATRLERQFTTQRLQRRLGRAHERDFIGLRAWDIASWEDDFQGDTLNGLYQTTASGANSAAAAISTGVVNGAILLDAGDANSGRCDLSWGLHYQGQLNAVYAVRASINSLATRKFEIGFTDVVSGTDAGALNGKAGNTWTADNAAILVFDTSDDTYLSLMGVKATVAATPVDLTDVSLSAATYYYFGVALEDDRAFGFVLDANGRKLAERQITAAITATTLLTPWLFIQNRAGSAGSMTVDWHRAYQHRTTTS